MPRVSIELVPRNVESLEADLALVRERLPAVTTINIPDLLRFELRSWDACALARRDFKRAINRCAYGDVEAAMAAETEATIRGSLDPESLERIKRFGAK